MTRRKRDGLVAVVVGFAARLPWWAGVALALGVYLWLHSVAQRPIGTLLQPGQGGTFAISAVWRSLAVVGQYLFPCLFLIGAVFSAYSRNQAKQLHAEAANHTDGVSQGTWREFEVLVGEYFRREGFSVLDSRGGGPDGGVDVRLQKGSDRYLVQCKQWRARSVGVVTVRELYGVMAAQRVAGGFVVTSGDFTYEARSFADGREIQLINGRALQSGVRNQAGPAVLSARPALLAAQSSSEVPVSPEILSCPHCHAPMVLRRARSGATTGKQFWGCSFYGQNKCRGTLDLA